jgi:general secretion pathway protein L
VADNLFLRLRTSSAGEDLVEWLLQDPVSHEVRLRGSAAPAELAERFKGISWSGHTYAILQTEELLLTSATIPSKQPRQIMQAVPYAVEEKLAADIEDCHFAVGERQANGDISVAVMERLALSRWIDSIKAAGLAPECLLVDVLQLPQPGGSSLLVDGERLLVRTSNATGFTFTLPQMALAIGLLTPEQRTGLVIFVPREQRQDIELAISQVNAEHNMACQLIELEEPAFDFICRHLEPAGLNLLQGEFRVARQSSAGPAAIWRSVAGLAVLAVCLHLGLLLAQGIYLKRQAQQFEAEALALYTEVFPNDKNIKDLRRQWRARLGNADNAGAAGFLPLLAATVQRLPSTELVLGSVNYNDSRGDLILQVQAPRSDLLVSFVQTLKGAGLQADIGTINQEADVVKGSIKIKAVGGV